MLVSQLEERSKPLCPCLSCFNNGYEGGNMDVHDFFVPLFNLSGIMGPLNTPK